MKVIRESTGLTQVALAERLQMDLATVQAWESGRRPLTALRPVDLVRLRGELIVEGAPPDAFGVLRDSLDADLLISAAVEAGRSATSPSAHPLAQVVHRRDLTNLVTWPFTAEMPARLSGLSRRTKRRGPVADRPVLGAEDRDRFFDHLLVVADAYRSEADAVLRRQAIYLLGFDRRAETVRWLRGEQRTAVRAVEHCGSVPTWVSVRSSAVAIAQDGDRDPLERFVTRGLVDEHQEIANLSYWAYWVGEIDRTCVDDGFMIDHGCGRWPGVRLLEHLVSRLDADSPHLMLNAHTLWALILARPRILGDQPELRAATAGRVEQVLDSGVLPDQTRQDGVRVLRGPARRGMRQDRLRG